MQHFTNQEGIQLEPPPPTRPVPQSTMVPLDNDERPLLARGNQGRTHHLEGRSSESATAATPLGGYSPQKKKKQDKKKKKNKKKRAKERLETLSASSESDPDPEHLKYQSFGDFDY